MFKQILQEFYGQEFSSIMTFVLYQLVSYTDIPVCFIEINEKHPLFKTEDFVLSKYMKRDITNRVTIYTRDGVIEKIEKYVTD